MEGTGKIACRFCAISRNQAPHYAVLRDRVCVAFLDRSPLFYGHVLVIPVDHFETLTDLPRGLLSELFERVQIVTAGVKKAMSADGTFVAINNTVSQSVPHFHIHVVPRKFGDGLKGFFWPRRKYASEVEVIRIQTAIRGAIEIAMKEQR
jgi:histidine triad (HIT) family protein